MIHVKTCSPYDEKTPYLTDQFNQFDVKLNFKDRLGTATSRQSVVQQALGVGNAESGLVKNAASAGSLLRPANHAAGDSLRRPCLPALFHDQPSLPGDGSDFRDTLQIARRYFFSSLFT